MSANAWRSVINIVLNGTFFCSSEFACRRIACGQGGAILNSGATYAWTGGPVASHSAAAKAGVTNLTQTLAVEWAPDDIRVNCLAPGLFPSTDRSDHAIGMMRLPFAAYLTGHTLVLDGGNWLRRYGFGMPEFEPVRERFDRMQQEAGD